MEVEKQSYPVSGFLCVRTVYGNNYKAGEMLAKKPSLVMIGSYMD